VLPGQSPGLSQNESLSRIHPEQLITRITYPLAKHGFTVLSVTLVITVRRRQADGPIAIHLTTPWDKIAIR
jgi:predicted RND superfamily exporter protein